jgi:hypothetical protein
LIVNEDDYNAMTGSVVRDEDPDVMQHYGIKMKSGRYPWGSGETPQERASTFQSMLKQQRDKKIPDRVIAAGWGMTTSQLRDTVTIARNEIKQAQISQAERLKEKGMSNVAIGRRMGNIPESTVRNLLAPGAKDKASILSATTEMLRNQVAEKKYIDVGAGVELHLNVSREKLKAARKVLQDEGYPLYYLKVEQLGTGNQTTLKVLCPPGTSYKDLLDNRDKVQPALLKSSDGGRSYDKIEPPVSISSKRVKVRYAEEGGKDADGVIYVRPGVKDVSLGGARYAQVRVAVDGSHYLKGMAMYGEPKDFPPGVDLVFNTNKSSTGNKLDAMKKMKDDPEDPFGSNIRDQVYKKNADGSFVRDAKGNRIVESTMNLVNEEGKWDEWSRNLSSQMLSKQKPALAKDQLDMAYESKLRELEEIRATTNPTLKKFMLEKFSDSADSSAVNLKAAALPRQATKVILPINTMKETEIYAPTFNDGERVVLVRFPHGGKFEIPELQVNNRHPDAKRLLGNAPDAVGIHSKVAERLSGADFDGDTVLVIPNNNRKVLTEAPLQGLKGFDPQSAYPAYDGMRTMDGGTWNAKVRKVEFEEGKKPSSKMKGQEMGKVSNLITDMTIKGAPNDEIVRAVRHSMVVIDAEKHSLNWKQSAIDNGIAQLKAKYQSKDDGPSGGAATLISRASSEKRVPDRKPRPASEGGPIDPNTGKRVYVETGVEYFNGNPKTIRIEKLADTDDAHTLSSGTAIEEIYAQHSNRLKSLANDARKEMLGTKDIEYSPSANKAYAAEVRRLEANLHLALMNAPIERQAQVIANARYRLKKEANPDLDTAELKKLRSKELQDARRRVGAKKELVEIEPREWEAIQAGAVSKTMLNEILKNTDVEKIKELATPREKPTMSTTDINRAKSMLLGSGGKHTLAEVANQLGVSVSTLKSALAGV